MMFHAALFFVLLAADKPAFDVASIKVNSSVDRAGILKPTADGLLVENMSIQSLVGWAWNLPPYKIHEFPGPRFDIAAKAADATPRDQLRLMLQTLLTDRFHLAVHMEKKDIPVYALVLAKGGPKALHDPASEATGGLQLASTDSAGKHWEFRNSPLSALAGLYSAAGLGRPILNMTGLDKNFDFTFIEPPSAASIVDFIIGDVFPEMQRQLGIRVEARTAPIEVLIIDHADKTPTEN